MNIEIIEKAIAEFEYAWLKMEEDIPAELINSIKATFEFTSKESGLKINIVISRNLGEDDE